MQKWVQNHLSWQRAGERAEEETLLASLPDSDSDSCLAKSQCPHFLGSLLPPPFLIMEPLCESAQVLGDAGCCDSPTWSTLLLKRHCLTNSPVTELHTKHVFPPCLSSSHLFFLNNPVVYQVDLRREKEINVRAALRVLCITVASPARGKRGGIDYFWVFGTIIKITVDLSS